MLSGDETSVEVQYLYISERSFDYDMCPDQHGKHGSGTVLFFVWLAV